MNLYFGKLIYSIIRKQITITDVSEKRQTVSFLIVMYIYLSIRGFPASALVRPPAGGLCFYLQLRRSIIIIAQQTTTITSAPKGRHYQSYIAPIERSPYRYAILLPIFRPSGAITKRKRFRLKAGMTHPYNLNNLPKSRFRQSSAA